MVNIHVVGEPRSGKGLIVSALALDQADQGTPVDSNFWMDSPNVHDLDFFDMLRFLKKPRVEPQHLLTIDELLAWCDSYCTSSKTSRYASIFGNQAQKLGYDFMFTTQRAKRADINFRENTTMRFKATMQRMCDLPKCIGAICENFEVCHVRYDPLDLKNDDEDIIIGKPMRVPFVFLSQYWHRYDTYEAVPPIGLDEALEEFENFDPIKKNNNVNRKVEILMECWQPTYTLDEKTVKDILLEQGESWKFSDVVYARFRRKYKASTPKYTPQMEKPQEKAQPYPVTYISEWHKLQALTSQ